MPAAPMAAPMTSGLGAASPGQGDGNLFNSLAQAITPEAMQAAQLKKSETEAAIYEAATAKRQALLTQLQNNMALATDKGFQRQTAQAYQGTGIKPPSEPAPGGGTEVSAAGLGAESFPTWFSKNQQQVLGTPQGQRSNLARLSGVPMTPQQAQQIEQLPYIPNAAATRVQEEAQVAFQKQVGDLLKPALKTSNMTQIKAAVQMYEQGAQRLGLDPAGMDSYLQAGIANMSPMEKARMRALTSKADESDAMSQKIKTLLGPEENALKARADELRAMANSTNLLSNPRAKALAGQYADDTARVGLINDEANWYSRRQATGVGTEGGLQIAEFRGALSSYGDSIRANTQLIGQAEATKRALLSQPTFSESQKQAIAGQVQGIQKDIDAYKGQIEYYQQAQQQLIGNPPAATPPGGGTPTGGGGQKPPAGKTMPKAGFQALVRDHFGGDVNKAKAYLQTQGIQVGN